MLKRSRSGAHAAPFIFLVSVGLSAVIWASISLIESYLLNEGPFLDRLLLLDPEHIWIRVTVVSLLLAFGAFAQSIAFRRQEALQALKNSEELYRTLVRTSPEAVTVTDLDGIITFASSRTADLLGADSTEEIVGKLATTFFAPEDHERFGRYLESVVSNDKPVRGEFNLIRKDGSSFIGELNASHVKDERGRPRALIGTTRDITRRRQAEDAIEYRHQYERIITSLSSKFITVSPQEIDSNITYALKTIGEFTGADRSYVFQLHHDGSSMSNTHEWCGHGIIPHKNRLQNLPTEAFAYSVRLMADGAPLHVPRVADLPEEASAEKAEFEREGIKSVICVPMMRPGRFVGFLGFDSVGQEKTWSEDEITLLKVVGELLTVAIERESAERALRESEEIYRSFVQNFQGMAYRSQMDWVPLFFHGAVESITGYTEAELIAGRPRWDQIIHPDDWLVIGESAEKIRTVPSYSTEREYRIIRKDGQIRWLHELAQNVCDDRDRPMLVQGALYDITERVHMEKVQAALYKISEATNMSTNLEELLQTIHQILGTLIDTTNFYVALYDADTERYSFPICVDQYEDGTDLPPEQLKKSLTDYVRKTGRPLLVDEKLHQELEEKGEVVLVGQPSPIWLGVPLKTPHGIIGVVTVQSYSDPTLYKESDMDLMTFVSGHIAMAIERKQQEMLLRQSEEDHRTLVETMRDGVMKVDTGEDIMFANPAACSILGYAHHELEGMNLRDIVVSDDLELIHSQTRERLKKRRSRYDLRVVRKDGEERLVSISAGPCLNDRGKVVGTVGVFTDITELKRAQEEGQKLREKLANAQRMESLGVLAGGVAHDLNNILGPLVGYPELIRRRLPEDSPLREQVAKIEESAQRAAEVVQDLLTMGRRGRYEMARVNINDIVTMYLESPDFCNQKARFPDVTTSVQLNSDIPPVYGSSTHLSKVIMNLVINALDAMPDGGTLTVKSECRQLTQLLSGYDNIEQGRYNIIIVKDTGIGIEEADTKRIFDPFFSKKRLGKSGSGLGLAVVYAVVKDHNGYVDVISEPDRGSDFVIYLPVFESSVPAGEEKPVYDLKGNEKVLVVDDVREQRELAVTLLSSLGYDMTAVASGREAVEYLRHDTCDVIILDMIMEPDFDGLDAYREIIGIHPDQKAVIVSGFSQTDRVKEAEKLGVTRYVKKPYTMQKLGKAVREVLAASPSSAHSTRV
ncbi:MAG: PAS domain S-box protein [Candidatus Zixiibacteriota bacterium]|nr:MAG: PAS domain S-box protein [candidate division Zixibacteria bacterium]